MKIYSKSFVETKEGLVFAVVENGTEQGKVLCFLRYITVDKHWQKVSTTHANQLLSDQFPQYLYYSKLRDCHLHAVSVADITVYHQPQQRLQDLLADKHTACLVERDCIVLCNLLQNTGLDMRVVGITGSLLIGAQTPSSDIDIVIYNQAVFNQARECVAVLIQQGQLTQLSHKDWQQSYQRRDCDLTLDEYIWHEQRKLNKGLINNRKFDLSLVTESSSKGRYKKLGRHTLQCTVISDTKAFAYPAEFLLDDAVVKSIACYTATYAGQAVTGELIEAAGLLEQDEQGNQRLVVGSTREAQGEYIKVIKG